MQPTQMRSVSFWGKFTSGSRISASHSDLLKVPIVLNEDKQQTGLTEITLHGHRITKDGVKVDQAKVQGICNMPKPVHVAGMRRLCDMYCLHTTCLGFYLTLPKHLNQSVL